MARGIDCRMEGGLITVKKVNTKYTKDYYYFLIRNITKDYTVKLYQKAVSYICSLKVVFFSQGGGCWWYYHLSPYYIAIHDSQGANGGGRFWGPLDLFFNFGFGGCVGES